jgi:alpha-L-fucosidase
MLLGLEKGIYKARIKIIAKNAMPKEYDYSVTLNVFDPLPAKVISGVQNGLNYQYYESSAFSGIPDFKNLDAIKCGITNNFDLSFKNRDALFAMVFTGYINVKQTAVYSYILKSDDGSRLFIDDSLIIDNDGLGSKFKSALIGLEKGFHNIRLEYIQNKGGASLEMYYEAESIGIKRTMVTDSELYH